MRLFLEAIAKLNEAPQTFLARNYLPGYVDTCRHVSGFVTIVWVDGICYSRIISVYDKEVHSVQWRSHVDLEVCRENVRKVVKLVGLSLRAKERSCLTVRMARELGCQRQRKMR